MQSSENRLPSGELRQFFELLTELFDRACELRGTLLFLCDHVRRCIVHKIRIREFRARALKVGLGALHLLLQPTALRGEQATPRGRLEALEAARDAVSSSPLDPAIYVGLDVASTVAFDDTDDPLIVMFRDGATRSLAEVSFLLGRLRKERMERVRLVFAPELREHVGKAIG
jgi:hypothetical protein